MYLPVDFTGTEVEDLLTFFISAYRFYSVDAQTLHLRQQTWRGCMQAKKQ